MSDQEQKIADPADVVESATALDGERADIANENEVEVGPPPEIADQEQDQQLSDNTGETDEIQGEGQHSDSLRTPPADDGEEDPEMAMTRRLKEIDALLEERQRRMLSYVDQRVINVLYYKRWNREANEYFMLGVTLNKRLKNDPQAS